MRKSAMSVLRTKCVRKTISSSARKILRCARRNKNMKCSFSLFAYKVQCIEIFYVQLLRVRLIIDAYKKYAKKL